MGYVYADISIKNPKNGKIKPILIKAMVDTGAMTLCIPEHVRLQLALEPIEKREVTTADGKREVTTADGKSHIVPYVGPVQIEFENRTCFTGALVIGDSVLMGAVPMEDMDLVINPSTQTVSVNPESPNIPSALVK